MRAWFWNDGGGGGVISLHRLCVPPSRKREEGRRGGWYPFTDCVFPLAERERKRGSCEYRTLLFFSYQINKFGLFLWFLAISAASSFSLRVSSVWVWIINKLHLMVVWLQCHCCTGFLTHFFSNFIQPPPPLLCLLPCFFDWIGDRTTFDVILQGPNLESKIASQKNPSAVRKIAHFRLKNIWVFWSVSVNLQREFMKHAIAISLI